MERRPPEPEKPEELVRTACAESIPAFVEFARKEAWETGFNDETIESIGRAVEEALQNILHFACRDREAEIRMFCTIHDSGTIFLHIIDTGAPFNMLLTGTFPEARDFVEGDEIPSTKIMKKVASNIEYRRDATRNILIFTIWRDPKKTR